MPPGSRSVSTVTILRLDPSHGCGPAGQPRCGEPQQQRQAHHAPIGLRNPFRFAFRPGTSELWVGDVGGGHLGGDQPDRDADRPPENFGWPCYEGAAPHSGFQSAGVNLCTSLYSLGHGHRPVLHVRPQRERRLGRRLSDRERILDQRASGSTRAAPIRPRTTAPSFSATTRATASGRCPLVRTGSPTPPSCRRS